MSQPRTPFPPKNSFGVNGPLINKNPKIELEHPLQMKKNKKQKKNQTITTCWCEPTVPISVLKIPGTLKKWSEKTKNKTNALGPL